MCCDLVEKWSHSQQDHVLVWLCRLQYINDGIMELRESYKRDANNHNRHQHSLIQLGLEAQLREWQARMPGHVSAMRKLCSQNKNMERGMGNTY